MTYTYFDPIGTMIKVTASKPGYVNIRLTSSFDSLDTELPVSRLQTFAYERRSRYPALGLEVRAAQRGMHTGVRDKIITLEYAYNRYIQVFMPIDEIEKLISRFS